MSEPAHPWMPESACDDDCLPRPGVLPLVSVPRQVLRLLCACAQVLAGMALALVLPLLAPAWREVALRAWFRGLLAALRIRLEVLGEARFTPPGGGVLVVANHVSWLDPVVLAAVQPLRMVAKHEVRDWWVIGPLARRAGTIFVHRERLLTLPAVLAEIRASLAAGEPVGVFPEGTSGCGRTLNRMRPAVFQTACDATVPVRPVALRYHIGGTTTSAAAFVGTPTLWQSAVRLARVRGLVVQVRVLPLLAPDGPGRHALAAAASAALVAELAGPDGAAGAAAGAAAAGVDAADPAAFACLRARQVEPHPDGAAGDTVV